MLSLSAFPKKQRPQVSVKEEITDPLPGIVDDDAAKIVARNKLSFKFPTSYFEPDKEPTLTLDDFLLITKIPDFIRSRIVQVLDELNTGMRDTFGAYCAFRLPDRLPRKHITTAVNHRDGILSSLWVKCQLTQVRPAHLKLNSLDESLKNP